MGSQGNTMPRCPHRPLVPRMPLPVSVAMVTAGKGVQVLVCSCVDIEALLTAKLSLNITCRSTFPSEGTITAIISLTHFKTEPLFLVRLTRANICPKLAESSRLMHLP